jgi:hypothetical protein
MVKISFLEWFAYIITIVGFIVMGIFLYHMSSTFVIGGKLSNEEMAATGQVGDFMGGVIGSIWALAGVFLYFSAIKMQNKELENQAKYRKEDAIMDAIKDFESTFFSLLSLQQKIKEELHAEFTDVKWNEKHELVETSRNASGNDFFMEALAVLQKMYFFSVRDRYRFNLTPNKDLPFATGIEEQKHIMTEYSEDLAVLTLGFNERFFKQIKVQKTELKKCQALYFLFSVHFSSTIGHYCRHLYNILKYMDQVQLDIFEIVRKTMSGEEQREKEQEVMARFKRYAAFLQSGLSSSEMTILFYNALIYDKTRKLYLRYNLLENLQDIYLIKPEHKDLIRGFVCKTPDKMIEDYLSEED